MIGIDRVGTEGVRAWRVLTESRGEIPKLTPLERAIAVTKDRRRRYDAKMEREGFKRLNIWVREDRVSEVKDFVQRANSTEPEAPTQP